MQYLKPPQNPITEERGKRIAEITARVVEQFSKNYLLSYTNVMVEHAKAKKEKHDLHEAKKAKRHEVVKPRRPRGDEDPEGKKPPKEPLSGKLLRSEEVDGDIDPYVVYVVEGSYKRLTATVYRRYKEFKELNGVLGKLVPKEAKLPPPSSKFGMRNLKPEFIREREKSLGAWLKAVCADDKCAEKKELRDFLGVGKERNQIYVDTFEAAAYQTRWDLWIWKRIVYDTEGQFLSKLCVEEVKRDMWSDIVAGVPPDPKLRRATMKVAYKAITAIIDPPVQKTWAEVQKQVEANQEKIEKPLTDSLVVVLEQQDKLMKVIAQAMQAGIDPVLKALTPIIEGLLKALAKPLAVAFGPVAEKKAEWNQQVIEALTKGDAALLDPFCNTFNTLMKAVEGKINDGINEVFGSMLGSFKASISLDALSGLFDPLDRVKDIVKGLFNLFDGTYIGECLKVLIEEKKKILQAGPEAAERNMDWEEWEMRWKIRWTGSDIYWAGRDIYWGLWTLLSELGPIADLVMEFTNAYSDLHATTCTKIAYKFGDYLHGAIEDKHDSRSWEEKVNASIVIGWERGVKHFIKHVLLLIRDYAHNFIKAPIMSAVQKLIIPLIEDVTKPLSDNIPPPCDTLLDVPSMVQDVIDQVLDQSVFQAIDEGSVPIREGLEQIGVLSPAPGKGHHHKHHSHDKHHDDDDKHHHHHHHHDGEQHSAAAAAAAVPAAPAHNVAVEHGAPPTYAVDPAHQQQPHDPSAPQAAYASPYDMPAAAGGAGYLAPPAGGEERKESTTSFF